MSTIENEITAYLENFARHGATADQLTFGRACAWAGVLIATKQNEKAGLVNCAQMRRELAKHLAELRAQRRR